MHSLNKNYTRVMQYNHKGSYYQIVRQEIFI